MGEAVHMWGQEVYGNSVPLNFTANPKLLLKNKALIFKKSNDDLVILFTETNQRDSCKVLKFVFLFSRSFH